MGEKNGILCVTLFSPSNHFTGEIMRYSLAGDFLFTVRNNTVYAMQTLVDNVSLLSAQTLASISQLVVETGHEVVKKKPGTALRAVIHSLSKRTCIIRRIRPCSGMRCAK